MATYVTCINCGIQQDNENFWYGAMRHKTCKYCNKKTKIIPFRYTTTTQDISEYLNKIVFDPKDEMSIFHQTQMNKVFDFLNRQQCKEAEDSQKNTETKEEIVLTREHAWEQVVQGNLKFKTFCDWFDEECDESIKDPLE